MPAHRPVTARTAKTLPCTSLSTPGGAEGTSLPGANSTAREISKATANTPRDSAPCVRTGELTGASEPVEVGLAVGAHDGQAGLAGEQVGADRPHLLLVDRVEPAEDLAHRQVLTVRQLALAEPAHPGAGVLEPQHDPALELAAAAGDLLGGQPVGGDAPEFLADQPEHLRPPLGRAPGIDREGPGARVVRERRADAVDQPALLPDLLEQPRAHPPADGGLQDRRGVAPRAEAADPQPAVEQVRLLGLATDQAGPPRRATERNVVPASQRRRALVPRQPVTEGGGDQVEHLPVVDPAGGGHDDRRHGVPAAVP